MTSHWLSFCGVVYLASVKSVILFVNHELAGQEYTTEYRNIPVGIDILHICCRLSVACVDSYESLSAFEGWEGTSCESNTLYVPIFCNYILMHITV